jgi:hypothetical protein
LETLRETDEERKFCLESVSRQSTKNDHKGVSERDGKVKREEREGWMGELKRKRNRVE